MAKADSLNARSEQLQILEIDQHQQVEYPNVPGESEYVISKLIDSSMGGDKALPKAKGSAMLAANNPEILKATAISLPMTEPGENTNSDNNKKMLQGDSTSIVQGPICEVEGHSGPLFDSRGGVGGTSPVELDFNTTEERIMMITAFRTIHHAMSSALSSWENVANRLEEILVLDSSPDAVLSRDRFLHSENCFWVINVVQPIESMILNTTEQWDLFYAYACSNFQPAVYRKPELYRERLAVIIEDIEQSCSKLQAASITGEIQGNSRKSKDVAGWPSQSDNYKSARANLKEAKQGSKMGSRIALLTYVTVFYLPLALCTSMWSINDMFSTGILGFCIVTSAVSLLTYGITILLLNSDVQKYIKARRGARGIRV